MAAASPSRPNFGGAPGSAAAAPQSTAAHPSTAYPPRGSSSSNADSPIQGHEHGQQDDNMTSSNSNARSLPGIPPESPFKVGALSRSLSDAIGELPDDSGRQQQQHGGERSSSSGNHLHASSSGRLDASTSQRSVSAPAHDPTPTSNAHANGLGPPIQPPTRSATSASKASNGAPRNPLIDLIETEQGYVDDLALVIKKVAAAWSRSNFPPPALDTMFRGIEAVYRIDKQFLARLNDIGPNPSSPKALGDLLMRWIDDLEPAYTRYVNAYQTDFDHFSPVQDNPNLAPILQNLPDLSTDSPAFAQFDSPHPTLDMLFRLPLDRLSYYKKLYSKLLKSTQPGKSDHNLLVGANEKLSWLLDVGRQSALRRVTDPPAPSLTAASSVASLPSHHEPSPAAIASASASAHSSLTPSLSGSAAGRGPSIPPIDTSLSRPNSDVASASVTSSVERSSGQTIASAQSTALSSDTSATQLSPASSLGDLERRLDTSRTLDIFTMRPKKCKLQMNPPGLAYKRSLRQSGDVQVSFVPASDPSRQELFTPTACIFLLTDLFLMCERIPPHEVNRQNPSSDVWLSYPPLATKHLRVYRIDDAQNNAFEIEIMKKERLTVYTESQRKRDEWLDSFSEAISFVGPGQSLRVDTDVGRNGSPLSATSATSSGGRENTFSPQSWQTGGATSTLPPLPLSASTSHFPGSASSMRSPTPNDNNGLPLAQGPSMPHQQMQQGRQSPHPKLPFPPPRGLPSSPQMRGGPTSPLHPGFAPGAQNRPLPGPPSLSASSSYRPASPANSFSPEGYSMNGPMGDGMHPPQQPYGLQKVPSQRSVASFSSRSSKASAPPGNSGTASPIPPLPTKDQQYDMYSAQQGNYARGPGGSQQPYQQPDMRNGGLLSPSGSQPGMLGGQQYQQQQQAIHRSRSAEGLRQEHYRMPSSVMKEALRGQSLPSSSGRPNGGAQSLPGSRMNSGYVPPQDDDVSPPSSPVQEGPITSQLAAQMKCKVFVQQAHGQWKSLGTARLKLFLQSPINRKQLVVDTEKVVYISTIVLEDGVERVGKTGVAIELSDNGQRTGLVYMLQLKTEASATGLFQQLLAGSTRVSGMLLK